MVKSQTGTGKTASFVLPILQNILKSQKTKKPKIKVLALTPTRELSTQVANSFLKFSKFFNVKLNIVTVIGGENISQQLLSIQKGCDIVVATTGRLLDIMDKKQIDLSSVQYFVLDEADKMLDLGFENELDLILKNLPKKRQNLLFSATYPFKIKNIISKITNITNITSIKDEEIITTNIKQRAISVNTHNKSTLLRELIKNHSWKRVLVFMSNKRACDNIAAKFRKYNFQAESFHGNLEQDERSFTLDDFKNGSIQILFATDIASRGLHIDDISCVINFDLPRASADYVHRIGRTARAGKNGMAISFINNENYEHFKLISKRANINLLIENINGFEFDGELKDQKQKGSAPIKGLRKSKKDKLRENISKQK